MTGFFKKGDSLERELRAGRRAPSDELVSRIEGRVRDAHGPRRSAFRYAVPAALTAAMLAALAAVGGVGYAASSVEHAATAVVHVFAPAHVSGKLTVAGATAGGDQYRPGYGWGDPNHTHTGPPGLTKGNGNGSFAPPLTPKVTGTTAAVSTSFTIDEQAHLFISVIDKKTGKEIVINQNKSKVGKGLTGRSAKVINYLVLVPRTIPLKLTLPAKDLVPGAKYAIRIIARSPLGDKATLLLPFSG
jgi:hypothetical protein